METEIWKVYKESYNSRWGKRVYEVSDQGRAKINGILVKFSKDRKYFILASELLHRIVAKLFVFNPENKSCVDHINGDRYDNRAINLRWCTYIENNNNPITKERQSKAQKILKNSTEYKAQHNAAQKEAQNRPEVKAKHHVVMKDRRHMTNGIDCKLVKPELVDYYLERGYHFGRK